MLRCCLLPAAAAAAFAADMPARATAEQCGRCHTAIFAAWKSSSHAQSIESRLFQDALELAEADSGAEARETCLGCHAPIAGPAGDILSA